MSRYTYAGPYKNPTEGWYVKPVEDHFEIWIQVDRNSDGSADPDRPHTSGKKFAEAEDAEEYIEGRREFYEDDYGDYLEENHDSILQMERYEAFRNEC